MRVIRRLWLKVKQRGKRGEDAVRARERVEEKRDLESYNRVHLPEGLDIPGVGVLAPVRGGEEVLLERLEPLPGPVHGPQAAAGLLPLHAATEAPAAAAETVASATASETVATAETTATATSTSSVATPVPISVVVTRHNRS